jgi:hypothetical protein
MKMTKTQQMEEIHESFVNGQGRQLVEQIDDYGLYDFWADYASFLHHLWGDNHEECGASFEDITISYFRVKSR